MDEEYLCRITGLSQGQWRKNMQVLLPFWSDEDGFLYQKKLSHIREDVESKSQKSKIAAEARWRKNKEYGDTIAPSEQGSGNATNSNSKSNRMNSGLQEELESKRPLPDRGFCHRVSNLKRRRRWLPDR